MSMWLYLLKQFAAFTPYRVIFGLNYEALWEDLRLVPAEGSNYENIVLTAISVSTFARSDERTYSSVMDVYVEIPCGSPTWSSHPGEASLTPLFFFRPVRDGYQFGIRVPGDWWNLHRSEMIAPLSGKTLEPDGALVLGLLPYGYLPEHLRRWNDPISLWYSFDRKQRRWEKRLTKEGWVVEANRPTHITHQYLSIGFYEL